ncbi:protein STRICTOSIDINE SYNTHASE-LIKE 12-like [Pistacia vera]|uniref:protein STRICTOSIDINE SYNTHASE-LIKE 12-like n=1 Tax=Pistacia vera TaxID=55513 RepID=UPI0012635B91|nr:protein STRICTOSIDINE SYNTHASE-LIKE 12-like [Pistacia vera]
MDSIFAPAAMFPISLIIFFLSLPSVLHSLNYVKLPLPLFAVGPESSAFDAAGAGPYTGVADGRILKYVNPSVGFVDYGVTSPNRSKALCVGYSIPALGPTCGRPLGLGFNNLTGDLYIADAYLGLLVLPKNQTIATQLATSANGVPFRSPDGLDVDPVTGDVYFTDASAVYRISQILLAIAKNDSTGRLLKYDIKTKQVTVLLKGLSGPAGTAVSPDGTFVLVTEFIGKRIQKYWLKGPKANTAEVLITFKGRPDNIKRNRGGDFWVAVNQETIIPLVMKPEGIRLDANGTVKESRPINLQYGTTLVSEVQEFSGALYIGSMYTNFIGVYK